MLNYFFVKKTHEHLPFCNVMQENLICLTMKKKKITPKDLDLNIEETGGKQSSPRFTETKTCGYYCNTIDPTLPDCKTVEEEGCLPTQTCWTIEPECETKAGCHDSNSHAQLCCPVTNQNGCKDTVDNCASVDTCSNTVKICLVTSKDCVNTRENCLISEDKDETCLCIHTVQETCEPLQPITQITGCK